jgi:hypothetical protein
MFSTRYHTTLNRAILRRLGLRLRMAMLFIVTFEPLIIFDLFVFVPLTFIDKEQIVVRSSRRDCVTRHDGDAPLRVLELVRGEFYLCVSTGMSRASHMTCVYTD